MPKAFDIRAANGWSHILPKGDILERLLVLNLERAGVRA